MGLRTTGKVLGLLAVCWLQAGGASASESGPVIVIPGKPGVPVIINGRDASWGIVEGDWGLSQPGNINPTVIYPIRSYRYPVVYSYPDGYRPVRRRPHRATVRKIRPYCACDKVATPSVPAPVVATPVVSGPPHYFPTTGRKPRYGRREVDVPRPPEPAQSFQRSFGVESDHNPAPATPPQNYQLPAIVPQPQRRHHP